MNYILILLLLLSGAAFADEPPMIGDKALSGDVFVLQDGRSVHLAGIHTPYAATPDLAKAATQLLNDQIAGHRITLSHAAIDRYGRLSGGVQISGDKNGDIVLQEMMLQQGLAFIYPPTGFESGLQPMFDAESAARQAQKGVWVDALYADVAADKAAAQIGHFALVVGRVVDVEDIKDKTYLDFGDNWRTDFTVEIAAHDRKFFRKAGIDWLSYKGKTVRVRGWVKRNFGPMITVTHPAQIEILP